MNKDINIKVSVVVTTYNHKSYIKECLDGILIQQTNFPIEIILGEDESNDGTREICIEYANKYPDIIHLFLRSRKDVIYINGTPTGRYNFMENLNACKGKYIALCEGDDYWTDPLKLQKQVGFLEENPDYGICFHNVLQINTLNETTKMIIPNVQKDTDFSINDYILENKTATCSIMFRKENFWLELPDWFLRSPFGDWAVVLKVMKNSNEKGRVLKDTMGVYRIHENGLHGVFHKSKKDLIKAYEQHFKFAKIILTYLLYEKRYEKALFLKKRNTVLKLMNLSKEEKVYLKFINYKVLILFYQLKLRFFNI